MAKERKARCYSKPTTRAYTRKSKYKKKGFIKAIPGAKLSRFHMGDKLKKFPKEVRLVSREAGYVRNNALESCRMFLNRHFQRKFGAKGYHMVINIFPHQILRENKMLTGAGADRMQSGMQKSFGKAMGSAAKLKKGTVIFRVGVEEDGVEFASETLKRANSRIPAKVDVKVV